MNQTQYQKEAYLFNCLTSKLRRAYREGGTAAEIAELVDEIDSFCQCTDFPLIRQRGAALLSQTPAAAAGTTG